MAIYPIFYEINNSGLITRHTISGKSYDDVTKQIVNTPAPVPTNTLRSFDLPLGQTTGKKPFGFRIGDMMVRGDGYVTFYSDHIVLSGAAPRLYVYDVNRLKKWKNVEVIVEYMRVSENSPPSYAGLGIGVRSIHEIQKSDFLTVPTYYVKHCFDGRFHLEKEWKHNSSYTKQSSVNVAMKPNVWNRMVFTIKTASDGGAILYAMLNDSQIRTYKDIGNWDNNPVIKDGVSCFIRSDSVRDFRVRKFSIKEVPV